MQVMMDDKPQEEHKWVDGRKRKEKQVKKSLLQPGSQANIQKVINLFFSGFESFEKVE